MPFGEILTGAFQRIWQHKKLWLLAMIGLALSGVGMLLYLLLASRWMGGYASLINRMLRNPGLMPGRTFADMMSSMTWVWVAGLFLTLLSLLGYIINLVARGAIINEAAHAWRNRSTSAGRGIQRGAERAVYVFLLDLMWLVPALLLGLGAVIAFFVLLAGTAAVSDQPLMPGLIATFWLTFVCGGVCLGLLYYLVYAIFSPLMYQSAVAGRREFSAAVREGWTLARANLGAMIIFWLLLLLVGFVLGAFQQALNTLAAVPLMGNWFGAMSGMMQGFGWGAVFRDSLASTPLLVLFALASAVLWFLITTFTQTLNLTVYSGVYEHLTSAGPLPAADAVTVPEAPAPTPASVPLIVPSPPPPEDEPPPTL